MILRTLEHLRVGAIELMIIAIVFVACYVRYRVAVILQMTSFL